MNKVLNLYKLKKYKNIKPKNVKQILKIKTEIKNNIEFLIKK